MQLYDDPLPENTTGWDGRTDGQADSDRQTIAVTLHLRFAARVNRGMHMYMCIKRVDT